MLSCDGNLAISAYCELYHTIAAVYMMMMMID